MTEAEKLVTIAENVINTQSAIDEFHTAVASDSERLKRRLQGSSEEGLYDTVIEKGKELGIKSEYDRFWDNFQQSGERTNYNNGFFGPGWNDETYAPKYDIVVKGSANGMFQLSRITKIINVDFSAANSFSGTFRQCEAVEIGAVDASSSNIVGGYALCFAHSLNLKKIEKFIIGTLKDYNFDGAFGNLPSLEELTLEGTVKTDFNIKESTLLNKASIKSILNALSSDAAEQTVTFSKDAVNNAFGIDVNDEASYTDEWKSLIESKSNWTISFV